MSASPLSSVGANLRRYRKQRGLSLREVASRSSLSKATVSTVESGAGNPTVATLDALSATLGIEAGLLLARPPTHRRKLIREEDAARPGTDDEPLDRFHAVGEVEVYDIRYEEGDGFEFGGHAPGTVERVLAVEGRLRAGPVQEPVDLRPGDYLSFDASEPHLFEALEGPVRGSLIVTYPGSAPPEAPIHSATRRRR